MFKLQPDNLPEDPKYAADLATLGFFINRAGQFRNIKYPDKDFNFHNSNNDRDNEVRREAYQTCQRREVLARLAALGLEQLYLPQLSYTKPQGQAFVPILAPPAEILKTRKRVIVLVNSSLQDPGVLAYRRLQRELGVNGGSVVNFVKELISRSSESRAGSDIFEDGVGVEDRANETPGFIVMNCGQLLFSHKFSEAKTITSWNAMPRTSAAYEPPQVTKHNHIPGNEDAKAHIRFVIDNVIKNKRFVAEDAEVYVIAIENGATHLVELMDADLHTYGSRITAMAIVDSQLDSSRINNRELKVFLRQRTREWAHDIFTDDPSHCVRLPPRYNEEMKALKLAEQKVCDEDSGDGSAPAQDNDYRHAPHWLEKVPERSTPSVTSVLTTLANGLKKVALGSDESSAPAATESTDDPDPKDDFAPICPVFADAENITGAGECIFTARTVQRSVLAFFEDVARHPQSYHNPVFQIFRPHKSGDPAFASSSPEKVEIDEMTARLENMRAALRDTPTTEEFKVGCEGLEERIVMLEEEVETLTKKALATGSLGAGEAQEARDSWEPVEGGGLKIPFAGVMVDSELVRAAGMDELVDEEIEKLMQEGENQTENGNGNGKGHGHGSKKE